MSEVLEIREPTNPAQVMQSAKTEFMNVSKDQSLKWETELRFAIQAFEKNDSLAKVAMNNQNSLRNAIVNVAAIGISLNPASKHAYLIPRKGVICLDISYMGLLHLACSTGSIIWGQCKIVREKDEYQNNGIDKAPTHTYNAFMPEEGRGLIVGAYCTVKTAQGDYLTEEMSIMDIFAIRDRSEAYKSGKSCPWITDEGQMIRKTVVKRASSYWPKVQRLHDAIDMLNKDGEGIDFKEEQTPVDKRTRKGKCPGGLPQELREVFEELQHALDNEDSDVVREIIYSFDEQEEQIAVTKCFDSKQKKQIKECCETETMLEDKNNAAKIRYLTDEQLDILTEYNWHGRPVGY